MTDEEFERETARRLVEFHTQAIEELDEQIASLQRRREQRQALLDKAELRAKGIKPCLICNRHVPSPCNSRGNMAEHGPWDGFCREFMENREIGQQELEPVRTEPIYSEFSNRVVGHRLAEPRVVKDIDREQP